MEETTICLAKANFHNIVFFKCSFFNNNNNNQIKCMCNFFISFQFQAVMSKKCENIFIHNNNTLIIIVISSIVINVIIIILLLLILMFLYIMFYVLSVNVLLLIVLIVILIIVTTNYYQNLVGSCIFFQIVMDNCNLRLKVWIWGRGKTVKYSHKQRIKIKMA